MVKIYRSIYHILPFFRNPTTESKIYVIQKILSYNKPFLPSKLKEVLKLKLFKHIKTLI
jgi:hypothetical protein